MSGYESEGYNEETKFFIGTEVEHSPYGLEHCLLFAHNLQRSFSKSIKQQLPHIYLGVNPKQT